MPGKRTDDLLVAAALAACAALCLVFRYLPMVDLPQHLALISALHRLSDPTTLYPTVFAARGELTPYLGYYHLVSLLNWLLPLELANRLPHRLRRHPVQRRQLRGGRDYLPDRPVARPDLSQDAAGDSLVIGHALIGQRSVPPVHGAPMYAW